MEKESGFHRWHDYNVILYYYSDVSDSVFGWPKFYDDRSFKCYFGQ